MSVYDFLNSIQGVEVLRESSAPLPFWMLWLGFFLSLVLGVGLAFIIARNFDFPQNTIITGIILIALIVIICILSQLPEVPTQNCYEISVSEDVDKKTLTKYFDVYASNDGFTWIASLKDSVEFFVPAMENQMDD